MSKQTLATKYRPKTFNDVVEQTPIKMTLQEQLKTDTIKNCYLFTGGAGTGKAQPLYSKVLTPNGFIEMKDVEVGTKVIGCDGEVHNVTATYDRGTRDIYELTFIDNTKVRCCDEHLWNFLNNDYSQYTVELNTLFNKPLCHNCVDTNGKSYDVWNYAVPIAKPTKFAEKAVTVPPYVLGFLIQEPKIDFENLSNYSIDITNKCIGDCDNYSYAFTGFLYNKICEDYSLDITANSENTFIPNDYKINSVENRIELISGMIDGIGFYANTTERDSFVLYTISSQLADDICFIVRSLGGYAEIINSTISCLPGYNVYVKFNDDIKLNLHNKEFYDYKSTNNIYKILENIEYIGKEPCKCIMIDSDEHLYITDGYTVTHNTTDARIFANEINKGIGSPIEMDAASNNSVEDVRKIIEDAKYKSMTGEYKVYIIDECFPANTLVSTENGDKPISEIKIGDRVQSMTGINNVTKIYKTQVSTNRLCCVHIDDKSIVTTKDHLFFTNEGWIEACNLKNGDIVYNVNTVSKVVSDNPTIKEIIDNNELITNKVENNRGLMQRSFVENAIINACNEEDLSKVESVEFYTSTVTNTTSFTEHFTCVELATGYVTMYDLQIEKENCYFVDGILVHNCHSLSNQAWQSLLKLIEEPPAKTVIVFCTTDPQKIPNTILSRVQRYDFRKISFNGIINRLKYIIEQENKENANIIPTEEGLEYIAKLADGGMRDAITTLDKCISYNSNLTLENVITALGGVNYDTMFNLVDSTYNYDSKNVITIIEDIYNSGANIKQFIKDFGDFVLDLCKYGLINSFDYIRIPTLYSNKLSAYTGEHYGFFNQLLGEMIKLSNLIKWESSPKSTIESTFILLCQKG